MDLSKRVLTGCVPDILDKRDFKIERPLKSFFTSFLPSEVSYDSYVKRIDDQDGEGCCVGCATSKALEVAYLLHKNIDIDFSIRYVYENGKKKDEWKGEEYEGTSIRGTLKGIKEFGACEENVLPFIPKQLIDTAFNDKIKNNAKKYNIKEYYNLFGNTGSINFWKLKMAIYKYGFAIIGMSLPDNFGRDFIYDVKNVKNMDYSSGHAMLIVGYNDKDSVVKVVNSWGKDFGKEGRCFVSYDILKDACFSAWSFSI